MLNKIKKMRESREEGFTLIELLVVIVIIGVLAAIALPIFLNQQKAAIAAGVKSDVRSTVTAVNTYLIKAPTTTNISFIKYGNEAPTGTGAAHINVKSLSDPQTAIVATGKWDNYQVFGSNVNLPSYSYEFNSTTGKYTETFE